MREQDTFELEKRDHTHLRLISSIISQQLSTKVAKIINERFMKLFKKKVPTPKDVLALDFETLRGVGLSNAKTNYVRNICEFFIEHKITDKKLDKLNDEEVIELLTQIKGVGRWTVEMLLMFSMGREDVFSPDDLVIRQTITEHYKLDPSNKKEHYAAMHAIAEKWRPYRTYACKYLWGSRD